MSDSYQNGTQYGRNNPEMEGDNFSNSFIEGKSFSSNKRKTSFIEKPQSKGKMPSEAPDSEINDPPRNIRDLEANSKMLDLQNKNISAPSIGPYPISSTNNDPTVTMRSISEVDGNLDKKLMQKRYVQELEEQIRIRDKIKNEEEVKRNKKYQPYHPETGTLDQEVKLLQSPTRQNTEEVCISSSHIENAQERRGLGSAPKAAAATIISSTITGDPFGGNIPTRKKIDNRIDQQLESRGSIFSGRDEKSVLIHKRNLQQQHMREELLRQIEEKKARQEQIKKKQIEEDMKDEFRIKQELQQLDKDTTNGPSPIERLSMKKAVSETIPKSDSYLPEITTRNSEPIKVPQLQEEKEENVTPIDNQKDFETTAAFASYKEKKMKEELARKADNYSQNPFSSAIMSETNKIKNMIQQVDNKQELQSQISKKMDIKAIQGAALDGSPISNGPIVGNTKLGELSEIVKQLLEDQRKLKSKLNERDEIIADLSKNQEDQRRLTHGKERRSRSQKPVNSKKIGSAGIQTNAARKLREKHTQEKERVSAIENKIVKARQRKAELSKGTYSKVNKAGGFAKQSNKSRPNSDFDPKQYKNQHKGFDETGLKRTGYTNQNLKELNV